MGLRHLYRVAALIIVGLLVSRVRRHPQYTYVTDSADSAYFKVPPSWHQVNRVQPADRPRAQPARRAPTSGRGPMTHTAKPSINHVFSSTAHPVAYASVLGLSVGRAQRRVVQQHAGPAAAGDRRRRARPRPLTTRNSSGFASLSDQVITDSHHDRGIREIFDYDLGTTLETFDLTVLTNSDHHQALLPARALLGDLLRDQLQADRRRSSDRSRSGGS